MLLAAIMAGWVHHVVTDDTCVGGYIDDRTVWTTAQHPAPLLERAARRTKAFDDAAGLSCHPDKGEVFAMTQATRRTLTTLTRLISPTKEPRDHYTMLGVRYHLTKRLRTYT